METKLWHVLAQAMSLAAIFVCSKQPSIMPTTGYLLRQLYWLPIWERVKFKLACLVRQSLSGKVPVHLADDCCLVSDSTWRSLRSAVVPTCVVPRKHSAVTATERLQSLDLACRVLFRSSCAIQTSSIRTVQTTAEETPFWEARKRRSVTSDTALTYLLTHMYLLTGVFADRIHLFGGLSRAVVRRCRLYFVRRHHGLLWSRRFFRSSSHQLLSGSYVGLSHRKDNTSVCMHIDLTCFWRQGVCFTRRLFVCQSGLSVCLSVCFVCLLYGCQQLHVGLNLLIGFSRNFTRYAIWTYEWMNVFILTSDKPQMKLQQMDTKCHDLHNKNYSLQYDLVWVFIQ